MEAVGNIVYAASHEYGLSIVDFTDPSHPLLLGNLPDIFVGKRIAWASPSVVVMVGTTTTGQAFLKTIDVSNPTSPHTVGTLTGSVSETWVDVAANSTVAAISYGPDLDQVDLVDVLTMETRTIHLLGTWANGLSIKDNKLYVASAYNGITVIDITNPGTPVVVGSSSSIGHGISFDVSVTGTWAWQSDASWFLKVVDVSGVPTERAARTLNGAGRFLSSTGNIVGVISSNATEDDLELFDVSVPLAPVKVSVTNVGLPASVSGILLMPGRVYLGCLGDGIRVYGI